MNESVITKYYHLLSLQQCIINNNSSQPFVVGLGLIALRENH